MGWGRAFKYIFVQLFCVCVPPPPVFFFFVGGVLVVAGVVVFFGERGESCQTYQKFVRKKGTWCTLPVITNPTSEYLQNRRRSRYMGALYDYQIVTCISVGLQHIVTLISFHHRLAYLFCLDSNLTLDFAFQRKLTFVLYARTHARTHAHAHTHTHTHTRRG